MKFRLISSAAALLAFSAGHIQAATTVDFDPTGELATQFTGGTYTESATGGLSGSVGITMASLAPASFTGSQSESYAASTFTVGSAFTIGAYFRITTLPTITTSTSFFRLGLTGGGTTNFANRAFSSINITNSSGAATFVINDGAGTNPTATFSLTAGQWYYYETTITRVENLTPLVESTKHDFSLFLSDSSGTVGSLVSSDSATNADGFTKDVEMDGVQFAGFKGHNASTGTGTVMDNFFVAKVPEPSAALIGGLGMLCLLNRRRRL